MSMPPRPGFFARETSTRTLSFEESQFFDAVDGSITFDGSGSSSAEATSLEYWMNMASEHPSSQFTILADRSDYSIHQHNVHVRIGDIHSLDDDTFDFVHVLRVIPKPTMTRVLEELIRVTKPGGCIQTVQFELKAKGKGPQLLLDFIKRNEEEQQTVLNKSVHVVQESSNSFELENAQSRDPSGFELLLGLIKDIIRSEKLMRNPSNKQDNNDNGEKKEVKHSRSDAKITDNVGDDDKSTNYILDALRNKPQAIEFANSVKLVEKLAY
ncbi:hypothetical protein INT45_000125 [Circinella minor]|uniref:Uncharacterized protein n=1 Tax=Circinella minor TaxID=1195481 RepID=A0A8H7S921_9FUNG|nr:hypothetical protein INT45_000125 [Circinella minor]